jgi:GTP-binding protein HflX
VDISSPLAGAQVAAVEAVLEDLGALDIPRVTVWNKVDALSGWCDGCGGGGGGAVGGANSGGADADDRGEETTAEARTREVLSRAAKCGAVAVRCVLHTGPHTTALAW